MRNNDRVRKKTDYHPMIHLQNRLGLHVYLAAVEHL